MHIRHRLGLFLVTCDSGRPANRSARANPANGAIFRGGIRRAAPVFLACAVGLLVSRSPGGDGVWIYNGSTNWSSATSWAGSAIADGAGSTAWFTNNISANRTITLDGDVASRTVGVLNVGDAVSTYYIFSFGGTNNGALTFDNSGVGAQLNLLAFGSGNSTTFNTTLPLILES